MIKLSENLDLHNYTLILPSVAIGNVGQLSIDLLIATLNLRKIGSLWNPNFLPICGLDPYNNDSESICSSSDFYIDNSKKIIILQLRAPYIGSNEFFEELNRFVADKKIGKVLILSSSYDYEKHDRSENRLQFLSNSFLSDQSAFESYNWKLYTNPSENKKIPGGGFANFLFEFLSNSSVPCMVLFKYCSEGDNMSDAVELVSGLNKWLTLLDADANGVKVKYPPSWKYLFGNPPSLEIY